ncbi:MAG: PRC-barrel domain-containing protein [Candidatus Rokubacteria bacterium]|nr:PRC-barrel domain-containing protein [Candidatus Rokubacteria bacterium]
MQALRKAVLAVAGGILTLVASQAAAQQPQSDAQPPATQQAPAPGADTQPSTAVQVTPPPGLAPQPVPSSAPDARSSNATRSPDRRASMELDAYAIIGSQVRTGDGREIGRVSRLMVDPQDGRITTVVIGIGGTLGFGEKQLAVPWSAVKLGEDRQRVVVIVDQRLLDQAPRARSERRTEPAASPAGPAKQK